MDKAECQTHATMISVTQFEFMTVPCCFACETMRCHMGCHHIELSPNSKWHCAVILPFGKFECQRMPHKDFVPPQTCFKKEWQSHSMDLIMCARAHIDDLLIITKKNCEDHLEKLSEVLDKSRQASPKINATKSFSLPKENLSVLVIGLHEMVSNHKLRRCGEATQKLADPRNKSEGTQTVHLRHWQPLPRHVD